MARERAFININLNNIIGNDGGESDEDQEGSGEDERTDPRQEEDDEYDSEEERRRRKRRAEKVYTKIFFDNFFVIFDLYCIVVWFDFLCQVPKKIFYKSFLSGTFILCIRNIVRMTSMRERRRRERRAEKVYTEILLKNSFFT